MKITDLSILCKWENLKNNQCIKYLFAPVYIVHTPGVSNSVPGGPQPCIV